MSEGISPKDEFKDEGLGGKMKTIDEILKEFLHNILRSDLVMPAEKIAKTALYDRLMEIMPDRKTYLKSTSGRYNGIERKIVRENTIYNTALSQWAEGIKKELKGAKH